MEADGAAVTHKDVPRTQINVWLRLVIGTAIAAVTFQRASAHLPSGADQLTGAHRPQRLVVTGEFRVKWRSCTSFSLLPLLSSVLDN